MKCRVTLSREWVGVCVLLCGIHLGVGGAGAQGPGPQTASGSVSSAAEAPQVLSPPIDAPLALAPRPFDPRGPMLPPGGPDLRQKLRAPNAVTISDRRSNRMVLIWFDRTDVETGYEIERRLAGDQWRLPELSDWEVIERFGPLTQWTTLSDPEVRADRMYCYRVAVTDGIRRIPSSERCAYTRDGRGFGLSRAQLSITTGNISDAGTDDGVSVRLNHRFKGRPAGHQHWLDYSHNDFERGASFTYDIDPGFIRDMGDITQIELEKSGEDDWCVSRVRLVVDSRVVFEQSFDGEADSCRWLRADTSGKLLIPFRALRDHDRWQSYRPVVPVDFGRIVSGPFPGPGGIQKGRQWTIPLRSDNLGLEGADLISRIESVIGHQIHGLKASWPSGGSGSHVTVGRAVNGEIVASFQLRAEIPILPDSEIFGSFRLSFLLECRPAGNRVNFGVSLFDFHVDVVNPTAIPGIGFIDDAIADAINRSPISFDLFQSLSLADLGIDADCEGTSVDIADNGTVSLALHLARRFAVEPVSPQLPVSGLGG